LLPADIVNWALIVRTEHRSGRSTALIERPQSMKQFKIIVG